MTQSHDDTAYASNGLEIAVIGMAGRFPAARNVDAFWQLLKDGREGLRLLSDDDLGDIDQDIRAQPNYVRKSGPIERKLEFDADLFGYTPQDASIMDPQFGVFHEVAWEALENAGYHTGQYDGVIGVYAGASNNLDWIRRVMTDSSSSADHYSVSSLTEAEYLTLRVAHKLDLTGPAISINTTCSTSLVNIHQACQALIGGECDIALAGGVNVSIDSRGYLHQEHMVSSSDGVCRPFDIDANGSISGEGCGIQVLKRLEDALIDRDNIVAVIKGTAVNNDGHRKVGFTAPSTEGQARVVQDALTRAGVNASSIGYIETHGTATKIGDPIEIAALKQVFGTWTSRSCAIGSVKSNIGHLGEAAGVAGAIKTILSLQHRQLPATLHYRTPNPFLGIESSPFFVNAELREWLPVGNLPLRAGVSSFGMGGTNAHAIFEQAGAAAESGSARTNHLIFLSANTPSALATLERNLIAHAAANPDMSIADMSYTLHVGRKSLPHRKAFVAGSLTGLVAHSDGDKHFAAHGIADREEPKLCFMFPGQGVQYRNMGRDLYEQEPVFRERMDACFAIAQRVSGIDLKAELFDETSELSRIDIAEPLLFIFEYSLAQLLLDWGLKPHAYLGHGVGEYAAACLAGVFSLEDAIAIVAERGRLMQTLPAGAMLAVPLAVSDVESLLGDGVCLAAVNSTERVTLSGDIEAIERLQRQLVETGTDSVLLQSPHAFHSHHVDAILEPFAWALRRIKLSAPAEPFLSNVSGTWVSDAQAISHDYWLQQLRETVRFQDCASALCRDNPQVLIEVGPGRTMSHFVLRNKDIVQKKQCIALIPQSEERVPGADQIRLFEGLCQLFVAGIAPDWKRYYAGQRRCRIPLPAYPFEGRCHYAPQLLSARYREKTAEIIGNAVAADGLMASTPVAMSGDFETGDRLTPTQIKLSEIWKKLLGIPDIGIDDDVFDHGVDSLLSIRVITEIREVFSANISLETIFALRTIAEQVAEIERKVGGSETLNISPIRAYGHSGMAPLSTSQKRLWIISQLEDDYTPYNNGFLLPLNSAKVDILQRAFNSVIQRHTILRTRYFTIDDVPMQQIRDEFDFRIDEIDLRQLTEKDRLTEIEDIWHRVLTQPIDLKTDLMLRAKLIRCDEKTDVLLVAQHHICTDDWSDNVLMEELNTLYEAYLANAENPLPPLPLQYIDYALWQSEWLDNVVLDQQMPYWRKKLAGIPPVHNLPLDRPRPKHQSYRGRHCSRHVDGIVLNGLKRVAEADDATLFMTMQAAFSLFLSRYSGESDIVLGFAVANRLHKEVENLIGFFVNTLVLRSDLSGNPTFREFHLQTKKNLLATYSNSHVPFEVLVDEINPVRSTSYEPIVQIKLIYLNQSHGQGGRDTGADEQRNPAEFDIQAPFSKYDLTLFFKVDDSGIIFSWEYATDLFSAASIERMAECFETLLGSIVDNPECPVHDLPLSVEQPRYGQALLTASQSNPLRYGEADGETREQNSFEFSLFYFASDDGLPSADKYRLLIEGARFADGYGFEAIWMPERHFDAFGGAYPNPAITAAALAATTQRIKLRAGSCVLPLHNPVRVAEDWSVIDNLSGGRVGLGFAAGYSPRDFTLAPQNYESRRDVQVEGVKTIKALWRGESVELLDGKGEATRVTIRPRPIQPELPVWVTTTGNEQAFRYAGRIGDNVLTHLMDQTLEQLALKIEAYREERAAAGHPGSGTVTLLIHTFITDDELTIFEKAKAPFKQYLIDSVGTPQSISKALGLGDLGGDVEAITEFAFLRYYQSGALFGTPERCLPLVDAIRSAGINELACLIDFGVEPELVLEGLPKLGRLRDLAIPTSINKILAATPTPPPVLTPVAAENFEDGYSMAPERCMHRLFESACTRFPDADAVVFEGERLSYSELNMRANRIAHYLIARHDAGPDLRIGLCATRSLHLVVGLLAILKSGAAYVPIEPDMPAARIAHIIDDGAIAVTLTCGSGDAVLADSSTDRLRIDCDEMFGEFPSRNPETDVHAGHAMYVMYTSGSTGLPKGVVIEHLAAVNFWEAMCASTHGGLPEHSRITLNTSFGFDVSLFALLQLLSGHCLYVVPQEIRADGLRLMEYLQQNSIAVLECTPTQFNSLLAAGFLDSPECQPARVLFCGEAISPGVWDRIKASKTTEYYNLYGPTECTIASTLCRITPESAGPHIGEAILNTSIYILDANGKMVPPGAVGEIHIGGAGMARGYLNRPELTAERFLPDPFSRIANARMYKTGDLGRWLPDGNLEFRGRNDFQIKLRGYRIELGEIESRLVACDGVEEAVVVMREDTPGEKYMVAYMIAQSGATLSATSLREQLQRVLPEYMLPTAFVTLDAFPLTPSGKLDRGALPASEYADLPIRAYEAPIGSIESAIVDVWQTLLSVERVGRHDNFFDLGGHSLRSVAMVERLRQRGILLDRRAIFNAPSVAELASVAKEGGPAADSQSIPPNLIPHDSVTIMPNMLPLAQVNQTMIDQIVAKIPGGAVNVQDIYPLSPLQEGIFFHHLLETAGDIYLMRTVIGFDTRERLDAVLQSIQVMIDRHDILRTSVHWQGMPQPLQVVQRRALLPIHELVLGRDDALAEMHSLTSAETIRLDLRQAPMLATYVGHDPVSGDWLLSILSHHLIGDHISAQLIVAEIQEVLQGLADRLPSPVPYRNYIARTLTAPLPEQKAFFHEMLGDVVEPTDSFEILKLQINGSTVREADSRLSDALALRIRESARKQHVTTASIFHVVWAHVLAHSSGRDDVVFGTVLSGRMQDIEHADQLIGIFINTLPVRIILGQAGVSEVVRDTHRRLGDLMAHEQASLILAQSCSGIQLPQPLFTALIDYRHSHFDESAVSEAWDGIRLVSDTVRNNYSMTMLVDDLGQGFLLKVRSVPGIDAERLMRYIETSIEELIDALAKSPERPLLDLKILPPSEREQVLHGFNATEAAYPQDQLIHTLFEAQAAQQPEAMALQCEAQGLNYAELNRRANQVAHRLIGLGVKPDDRVAICAERSLEMVIGLLGILKAGGAYVPLDPLYPADRLAYMLEDSAPMAVLTQSSLRDTLPMLRSVAKPVLSVEAIVESALAEHASDPKVVGLTSRHLAYVIYTSGSTGQPKGVMVEHRSAVNFWQVMCGTTHRTCGANARVALNAAFSFDMSLKGFLQLLSGHCLVLIPQAIRASGPALLTFLEAQRIDAFDSTPSQLEGLLAAGLLEPRGHRPGNVLLGGEAIGVGMWERLKASPVVRFHNMYGPTEATVDATIQSIAEAVGGPVIGKPIANARIYLLDAQGQPVPMGVAGEIYISGVGVARGYLHRPELTAERFLKDPFCNDADARMYRTGDLGRWQADGTLEYLGRNDFQVKVRGFRIELGEIESKLSACAGVREAVVIAREASSGDKRLVAYLVSAAEEAPSVSAMRERLMQDLPEYMIPSAFVMLAALPLTPNGKLDRKALPAPDQDAVASRAYIAPVGEVEEAIAAIWQELLGLARVGRHDHFFELGGHSLLVMQLVIRIREQLHVDVPLKALFERPMLSELAYAIEALQYDIFLGDELKSMQIELDSLSEAELQEVLDSELSNG